MSEKLMSKPYNVSEERWNQIFKKENIMIPKKVKCLKCGDVIDLSVQRNCSCSCNAVVITEGKIVGNDYVDVSPQLLNE